MSCVFCDQVHPINFLWDSNPMIVAQKLYTHSSTKMTYLVFALIIMVAINGIMIASSVADSKAVCTPKGGKCPSTVPCCAGTVCMFYASRCVSR
ncbi:hypothetical protein PUN28_014642 [Cardiocondyla obscurior]|uniref:Uncharacterized protein n=1 Tax=Cardiocondyla obscurior TaxID=286306 RepID=A0AAW2F4D0_9HYME